MSRSRTMRDLMRSKRRNSQRPFKLEPLEPRQLLAVVISEFMADNESTIRDEDGNYSDWIEIRNTTGAVDLDGWFLTDDAEDLTKWRMPSVNLGAGEHALVFASSNDRADAGSELHSNFKLSNNGEYLALVRPDGTVEQEFSPEYPGQSDDVSYGLSTDLSTVGYFVNPTPGSPNVGTPINDPSQAILITEIMYHPASEDSREEYIEIHNRGVEAVNLIGWQFASGVDYTFPNVSVNAGEYFVVAADEAIFNATYPGVGNVVGGWSGQLSNGGERIELVDSAGARIDRVSYADEGDWATREQVIDGGESGWDWQAHHDGGDADGNSRSLELVNLAIANEQGQNWTTSVPTGGTPGAANSTAESDTAPLILNVQNSPIIPRSTDPVVVSADVSDELGDPTVRLIYELGVFGPVALAMNDDGLLGDETAGDGTFSVTLPVQADGTVVEFYVSATDGGGNRRTWPAADTGGEQSANALYQVNDDYDPTRLWEPGAAPHFYQIMRPADREDFLSPDFNQFSDAQKNASFVVWDGTGVDVRHSTGIRIRGSASRSEAVKNNRINLPADNPWHGLTSLNVNAPSTVNQISGSALWRLGGLAVADASAVRMFSNGTNLKNGGVYNYLETPNSDMAANQFSGDSNGNFYRGRRNNESPEGGMSAGLAYLGPIETPAPDPPNNPYASYGKITNSGDADWSDVAELTYRLNDCGTEGEFRQCLDGEYTETYVSDVEEVADIDQWVRTLAMSAMLDNSEFGLFIGDARGDDYMMYAGVEDPRFVFVMHDLDSLYQNPTRRINRHEGVPALDRLVNHPEILPRYLAQLEDLAHLLVSDKADTTLDEVLRDVTNQGEIDSIKSFLDQRAAFVLSQISQELTIETNMATVGDYPQTKVATLDLTGTVPVVDTQSVLVNGELVTTMNGDGTWEFTSSLGGTQIRTESALLSGSDWSYLDDGSDQGTSWKEPNFDDAAWSVGPSPLGYGEGDEATVVGFVDTDPSTPDIEKNATTYFRSSFNVDDPSLVRDLSLRMQFDDAAIVYINGVEALVTDGLNSGDSFDTYSSVSRGSGTENTYETLGISQAAMDAIVAGENVIAVENHQRSADSSDVSFDLLVEVGVEDPTVQANPQGVILNPGINRVVVEAFDGPNGNGQLVATDYVDIWYDGPAVNNRVEGLSVVDVHELNLQARDSYLPGVPTLVRVSALDFGGGIERDLWDAEVYLSVDNPNIQLSTDRVSLVNGQGSSLVEFRLDPTQGGGEDFTLTASYRGTSISKHFESLSNAPVRQVGGEQSEAIENWSGVVHVTQPYVVGETQMLNLLPGTLVLLDGDPVGAEDSVGITVNGSINSLGTKAQPVSFTSAGADDVWGQIEIDGGTGAFDHTVITRAGNAPGLGHTNTAAAILMGGNAEVAFRNGSITDLRGKSLYSTSGDLVIVDSLLSRSVMGPEIQNTALDFTDSWIVAMAGVHHPNGTVDDNDGIYLHGQRDGQVISLRGGVLAGTQDDGIDTLGSEISVVDFIVRDVFDKAVSQFGGEVTIRDSLIANSDIGVNTKGSGTDTPHAVIDRTTIANVNTGIYAENKSNEPDVVVTFDVSNSIIRTNDVGDAVATDYDPADIHIEYSNVGEAWPGTGNTFDDPQFINPSAGNFYPSPGSVTINAGTPGINEADGTRGDQGYYGEGFTGEFQTDKTLAGEITADTVLAPHNGPFLISDEVVVAAGSRLIVLPGTSVFFDEDAELVIEGEMIAQGSRYHRIRFTADPNDSHVPNQPSGSMGLPDGPPRWDGIHFMGSRSNVNRISYADVEFAEDSNGSVGVLNSNALIDNITVAGTHLRMVYGTNVSMIVQNSVFPNMFAADESPDALGLDNISEHVKVTGRPPEGGQFVIRNNVFGTNKGHNDVIDADSGRLPNPILQVRDNVFMGAGDEELDLGGDVYVSGNLFANIFKDDETSDRGYANGISTGDAGTGTVIAVARNYFVDVDHAINLKRDTATIFENNSVYKIHDDFDDRFGNPNVGGAINLFVDEPGASPGIGAYVEGNVVWDAPRLFSNPDLPGETISQLEVANNLLDPQVADNQIGDRLETLMDLGLGNIADSGRFIELANGTLALDPGSAGVGSGPLGQDMGANIREGIWVTGEPGVTASSGATLTVAGPGIFAYRYRVDGGEWSADIPIGNGFDPENGTVRREQIVLTNLAPGPHQIEVLGQDFAGVWQAEPTVSQPWVVDASHVNIRINEVLASNTGAITRYETTPDYIELYNGGTTVFDLSGIGLSDDANEPNKFVFPAGTTIAAGGYLVVYADSETNPGFHTGFKLSASGEGVYLAGGVLDSVEFGIQLDDLSIGRVGDGMAGNGDWRLNQPTPGFANVEQRTGDPNRLSINEWFASGDIRLEEDFIELFNADELPVDLGGLYLSDHPNPRPDQHAFTALSFVAANDFVKLVADGNESAGADHLSFKLSADREHLGLFDEHLNAIDRVLYFAQTTDVTQGRVPDGAAGYEFGVLPTPGLPNEQSDSMTEMVASIAWDDAWSYDDSGVAPPANWNSIGFDDAAWPTGPGLVGVEGEPLPQPLRTELTIGSSAYYFRKSFELAGDLSTVEATFSTAIDDGAVVYVNGTEVQRIGMPDGGIAFDTFASRNVNEAAIEGEFTIPNEVLVQGTNVIAVEVHQRSLDSSDIVFGLQMQATQSIDVSAGDNGAMRDLLNGLRVTEIMFNGRDEYVELKNLGETTLQLNGVRLEGAVDFTFADVTLEPGQATVVGDDLHSLIATYGSGINAAGQYSGNLSNDGEEIILRLPAPFDAAILRFEYQDDWSLFADGAGASLRLVSPAPIYPLFDEATSWQPEFSLDPTRTGGTPGFDGAAPPAGDGVVINEILAHTDLPQFDSIELLNTTGQPIDIGGWYLSDSASNPTKFQIPLGTELAAGETLAYDELDFNATFGQSPNDFALDSGGDEVYLWKTDANGALDRVVDFVEFGATLNGESYGRVPGDTNGHFLPMIQPTFGCQANSPGRVGSIIVSELKFSESTPSPDDLAIDPGITSDDLDYLEIYNTTPNDVDLQGWRIRGAVDFDFAESVTIESGDVILLVPFDATNTARLNAFRGHFEVGSDVAIVGGYSGQLTHFGGGFSLERPGSPAVEDSTSVPLILEDYVDYFFVADTGQVLNRVPVTAFNGFDLDLGLSPGSVRTQFQASADLSGDGVVDVADLRVFQYLMSAETAHNLFDYNNDAQTDLLDFATFLNVHLSRRLGDTDLNGAVDASDYATLNSNRFQSVNCGNNWSSGDFNGDGVVDGSDFNIWNDNKFQPVAAAEVDRVARAPQAALVANARVAIENGFIHRTETISNALGVSLADEQIVDAGKSVDRLRARNAGGLQSRRTSNGETDNGRFATEVDDLFADLGSWLEEGESNTKVVDRR